MRKITLLGVVLLTLAGCSKGGGSGAKATPEAQETFKSRCSPCHGESGKGDGPSAAALTPKPRNFGDSSWQSSASDEHIKKAILKGGAAVGKSPMMPAAPDLESNPALVEGLVGVIRSFNK